MMMMREAGLGLSLESNDLQGAGGSSALAAMPMDVICIDRTNFETHNDEETRI